MRLLLDTHVFLWWVGDDERLSGPARDAISHEDNTVLVSVASAWEIAIKASQGRLEVPEDVAAFVRSQAAQNDFQLLPVHLSHAAAVRELPWHHRDPFDRMLVAQAIVEEATLVTNDAYVQQYPVLSIG
ncbi:MAG TPA: type II toxin-antitoxin system VapC family toxin [Deinococcales bacterium]|nr:type II toxin-antitoxin system VapC family toxin [Deinococcales bacterium]